MDCARGASGGWSGIFIGSLSAPQKFLNRRFNWRPLRAWALFAVIWIVGVGAFLLPSDYNQWRSNPWREMAKDEYKNCATAPAPPPGFTLDKPSKPGGYGCDPIIVSREFCEQRSPGPWCAYWPPAPGRKLDDMVEQYDHDSLVTLAQHSALVVGVPLAAFVLAVGLGWVAAGFRAA